VKFPLLFVFFFPLCIIAQPQLPDPSGLFDDGDIPMVEITINQDNLDFILDPANKDSDEEFSADFKFNSSSFTADEKNIGFRLRGNTSRSSAKKSFKVSFNSFEKGRDLDGFEKLNLNGEHNDPSMVRSKICWDIMNSLEIPSPRANHVELYINDEYYGLYSNIEHIDEEFIEEHFGNKSGNLYKCLYPADLNYKGSNQDSYKEIIHGRRNYELKINEEEDDYSRFVTFIEVLNQTTDAQFQAQIAGIFDVNSFLKALAVETLIAHWDNYGMNKNNFYLYDNPDDGKFYYIPFDLDNTLGIDFFNVDWAEIDIYSWYDQESNRPLVKRILAIDKYREAYSQIIYGLLNDQFNPENLIPRINNLKALIQNAAERDNYRTYDYGFSINDFNDSFTERLDQNHVRYGLTEFVTKRHQTATAQLDEITVLSFNNKTQISIYPIPSPGAFTISSAKPLGTVSIYSLTGQKVWEEIMTTSTLQAKTTLSSGAYLIRFDNNETRKLYIK
jgi:spore coat protein H